ncbi:MAG: tRNA (adenosine(37)-N6)-threonylcarbamoyltransferase complex transferase subunit TsaD, partial [Bacillota bacterium]
ASGGHTELVLIGGGGEGDGCLLGQTRDDAAGEAYDKVARLLELGYPGGPVIDRLAAQYGGEMIDFPRPMMDGHSLDFSFSGLKTAVAVHVEEVRRERGLAEGESLPAGEVAAVAASFQRAAVDVLAEKTTRAVRFAGVRRLLAVGGVAANSELRRRLEVVCRETGVQLVIPPPAYCTDNAAMVAAAGRHRFQSVGPDGLNLDVDPSLSLSLGRGGG